MLRVSERDKYLVYPSWAKFSHKWEDLPRLLSDPIGSGCLPDSDYSELGYRSTPVTFELYDGPAGGGIIRWEGRRDERWLGQIIFVDEASLIWPNGIQIALMRPGLFDSPVLLIEPRDEPGSDLGIGKRAKLYTCAVSPEHSIAAESNVYWIICMKRGVRPIKGLDQIPDWADSFGLQAKPLIQVPGGLLEESAPWFLDPSHENS